MERGLARKKTQRERKKIKMYEEKDTVEEVNEEEVWERTMKRAKEKRIQKYRKRASKEKNVERKENNNNNIKGERRSGGGGGGLGVREGSEGK